MLPIRSSFLLSVFCIFGILLVVFLWFELNKYVDVAKNIHGETQINIIRKILKERNEISLLLNKEKKKSGQLECNIKTVAGSGGWCQEDMSVALLYNFEWRIENGYSYVNWNASTLLKSAPKIAHYNDVATSKKSSTVGRPTTSQQPSAFRNINCQRMNLKLSSPQRSIVASLGKGRLGNQLSNFASCYAISKEYIMYHYLNPMQLKKLQNVFDLPELNDVENGSYYLWDTDCIDKEKPIQWTGVSDKELFVSRDSLTKYKTGTHVKLEAYSNDVQGFYPYIKELQKSVFIFKKKHMKAAKTIFTTVKNTYSATRKNSTSIDDVTMIGIHIRLTDFAHHLKVLYNMTFISNEFLTKAMTYCTKRYKNVIFYALSDDIAKAKEKLMILENDRFDIVFPGDGDTSSPAIDMALLSLADHSILSYGTFGMWGALLAGKGEVVVSKDFFNTIPGGHIRDAISRQNITNWTSL